MTTNRPRRCVERHPRPARHERGEEHIRAAILALQLYAEGETNEQELATLGKCILALQQILASDAKNRAATLGVTL